MARTEAGVAVAREFPAGVPCAQFAIEAVLSLITEDAGEKTAGLQHQVLHALRKTAGKEAWYLFNDFCIAETPAGKVLDFTQPWREPVCLVYKNLTATAGDEEDEEEEDGNGDGVEDEKEKKEKEEKEAGEEKKEEAGEDEKEAQSTQSAESSASTQPAAQSSQPSTESAESASSQTNSESASQPNTESASQPSQPTSSQPSAQPTSQPTSSQPTSSQPTSPQPSASHPSAQPIAALGSARGAWLPLGVPPSLSSLLPRRSSSEPFYTPICLSPGYRRLEGVALPARGDLVAIDCEFVALNCEEVRSRGDSHPQAEVLPDGHRIVKKEANLQLGRVTCLTSDLRVFLDDYILCEDPVADYLSRFSGLSREDLDVETSQHHLVTLKDAYSRLRRLVDRGCVFVGHGCGAAERR